MLLQEIEARFGFVSHPLLVSHELIIVSSAVPHTNGALFFGGFNILLVKY